MDEFDADDAEGSYVEGSLFTELLGRPGRVEILEVFLGKHYDELSAAQVADLAGVNVSTFHRNVDVLIDHGIVEKSRSVGGTQLYALDVENPTAKALGAVRATLLERVEDAEEAVDDEARSATSVRASGRNTSGDI